MKLFHFLALLAVSIEAGKAKKAAKKASAAVDSDATIVDDTELVVPDKKGKWASKQEKKKSKKGSEELSEDSEDEPGCVKKGKCDKGKKANKISDETEEEIEDTDESEVVSEPDSERNIGDIFGHLLGLSDGDEEKSESKTKPSKKPTTTKKPKTTATTEAKKKPGKWAGKWQNGKDKGKNTENEDKPAKKPGKKPATTKKPTTTETPTATSTTTSTTSSTTTSSELETVTTTAQYTDVIISENESADNDTRAVDVAEPIIEEVPEPPKPTTMWDVFRRIKANLPPLIPTTQPELTTYVPYGNEAREFFHAVLNSDDVAMPCINGEHQCNDMATCYSDPLSKEGYACKCKAGYRGHGKKNLPVVWGTDVEPTNEMFWITVAEQVSLVPELTWAFGLNNENSRTIDDIADRVRNMVVAGKEGTAEEGLWFLKESMVFNAGEIQGCVDIDECYEENKSVNANKPRLCKQTEYCQNTDGSYECKNDFSTYCALGLHNCHLLLTVFRFSMPQI